MAGFTGNLDAGQQVRPQVRRMGADPKRCRSGIPRQIPGRRAGLVLHTTVTGNAAIDQVGFHHPVHMQRFVQNSIVGIDHNVVADVAIIELRMWEAVAGCRR